MKMKKLISFILSLTIIISTLASFTMVSAVEGTEVGFINVAVNSEFNEENNDTWTVNANSKGNLVFVDDTKNTTNKVLRYTGNAAGSYSLIYYNGVAANTTYYMSFKVRVATVDGYTPEGDMFLYPAAMSDTAKAYYPKSRPQISQDDWAVCSGVFTTSADATRIGFKIISTQGTSNANVKDAIYEIDNFVLYELTNSKNITLPDGVTIVSGAVTGNVKDGNSYYDKIYAMPDSNVVLKYETANKVLSSEQAVIEKNVVEYSFTMPNENVTVSLAEPPVFTNLIVNGDMENTNLAHKWTKGSNAKGAKITIEEDTDTTNSGNHVLRFDGTDIGNNDDEIEENRNDNPMSYMSYVDKLKAGRYYYSYKIKKVSGTSSTNKFYAYNSSFYSSTSNLMYKPEINDNWITRSGICTTSAESSFNFKIINNQTEAASASASNVPDVIYDLDNVIVYDFTDVYEIELPAKTNIAEGGKRLDVTVATEEGGWVPVQTPKYYAKAGDIVKLEYTGNKALKIEGAEYTLDGNVYTFTMPALATYNDKLTVTEVENITFDEAELKIKVARPKSFVLVAAKYDEEDMSLAEAYTANYETTAINQDVTLSDIEEFKAITDWTDMRIFVWSSFTDIIPLCDTFICAQ